VTLKVIVNATVYAWAELTCVTHEVGTQGVFDSQARIEGALGVLADLLPGGEVRAARQGKVTGAYRWLGAMVVRD
jgi:hypothetical protein